MSKENLTNDEANANWHPEGVEGRQEERQKEEIEKKLEEEMREYRDSLKSKTDKQLADIEDYAGGRVPEWMYNALRDEIRSRYSKEKEDARVEAARRETEDSKWTWGGIK